jgi:hypothetical protein
VGHGVGIPAFGQHRDRHDATDLLAEPPGLADRVHDLAQEALVGKFLRGGGAGALRQLAFELLDLGAGVVPELWVQCIARFELRAVDQERARVRAAIAVLVVIAKQLEATLDEVRLFAVCLTTDVD